MTTWVLDDILKPDDHVRLVNGLKGLVDEFKGYREKLGPGLNQEEFMGILRKQERISEAACRLASYAGLSLSEDTTDGKRISHQASISQICAEVDNDVMFFGLWFRDLSDEEASKYMEQAGPYRYMLERIRAFRKHILTEKEEKVINLKDLTGSEALTRLYDVMTGRFRFEFQGKTLTYEEIGKYKTDPDRKKRKESYESILSVYSEEEDVLSEIFRDLILDTRNEELRLRNFRSVMEASNLGNDIPDEVSETLLDVVRKERGVFQDYFRLKAKVCRIEGMDRYDVYAPYARDERAYPFEECKGTVLAVCRGFDETFYNMAKRIFDERHIHSEVGGNKQHGGYCASVVKGMTPYIMLNHRGKLEDLYSMMHEVGHAVHALRAAGQTEFTYRAPLPLAETASIFSEMLLSKHLLKDASGREKTAILVRMLDNQYATILRQAYFVAFEKDAHEAVSEGAGADLLNSLYLESLKEQFGPSVAVPDMFKHEWKTIQHMFYHPFYCLSYAFGNLLVLALYQRFIEEGMEFVPMYMRILGQGGSDSPKNILYATGIDITERSFWESGFEAIKDEMRMLERNVTTG